MFDLSLKDLTGKLPPYLSALLHWTTGSYQSQHSEWLSLQVPRVCSELGKSAFIFNAPTAWKNPQWCHDFKPFGCLYLFSFHFPISSMNCIYTGNFIYIHLYLIYIVVSVFLDNLIFSFDNIVNQSLPSMILTKKVTILLIILRLLRLIQRPPRGDHTLRL